MTDRYDELRAAAEAATPGPWRQTRTHRLIGNGYGAPWVCEVDGSNECFSANSAFIAAANPATVLTLLSERDALLAALRETADDLAEEILDRYDRTLDHPTMKRRYDRDMEPVIRARALLTALQSQGEGKP